MGCAPPCNDMAELGLRHFNDLAVGETAAPACFLRENAEGQVCPRCQVIEMTRHVDTGVKRESEPPEHGPVPYFKLRGIIRQPLLTIKWDCIMKENKWFLIWSYITASSLP